MTVNYRSSVMVSSSDVCVARCFTLNNQKSTEKQKCYQTSHIIQICHRFSRCIDHYILCSSRHWICLWLIKQTELDYAISKDDAFNSESKYIWGYFVIFSKCCQYCYILAKKKMHLRSIDCDKITLINSTEHTFLQGCPYIKCQQH